MTTENLPNIAQVIDMGRLVESFHIDTDQWSEADVNALFNHIRDFALEMDAKIVEAKTRKYEEAAKHAAAEGWRGGTVRA